VIPLHPVAVEHLRKITHFGLTVFDWPLEKRALYDQWHNIQREAGIDLPCHEDHTHTPTCHVYGFHSLKKACGTLNAARMPEAALNAFMRHASGETTRKYYQNQERIERNVSIVLRQLPVEFSVALVELYAGLAVHWGPAPRPPGFC